MAGTITDAPDSPPNTTLQLILASAINTITAIPKNRFLFQNAAANAVSDTGTISVIRILAKSQLPMRYSFSISRNSTTKGLTDSGLGNQNMLVMTANMEPITPAQLLL